MDPIRILAWIAIGAIVLAILGALYAVLKVYIDSWRDDFRRKRAHDGRLQCAVHDCQKVASFVTPLGYYCVDHEGAHSKKHISVGSVQWSHPLNWTQKERK